MFETCSTVCTVQCVHCTVVLIFAANCAKRFTVDQRYRVKVYSVTGKRYTVKINGMTGERYTLF